ncbi:hypothetical protein IWQ56_006242 [Coemansia nantahalensis]|uniref:Uncharacterized protein n=2 Tax=Coemansia TaxID=4863 RepID=A0ACC1KRV3_9FUNG|nr:hypothetical protein IWQ56_006242 [Coemansia nantahalensis]KAJ2794142.1 hypothetical protein H4R21_005617 [Coemansia helicoidea]
MDATRSTIIKGFLAREGPQTSHQLYHALMTRFPDQFKGVTRAKFKTIYLKNLKSFGQISAKHVTDEAVLKRLAEDPASKVRPEDKKAWLLTIDNKVVHKHATENVRLDQHHSEILENIEKESALSRAFWEGDSNTPHDWRAALRAAGHKTSL